MSLLIGIHINEALAASEAIVSKVGDRVFPIVAPSGVEDYPYIVYQSTMGEPELTKDGVLHDNVATTITVVSKSYGEAIEIANEVRNELEFVEVKHDRFAVTWCSYAGGGEMWLDDLAAYAIEMSFNFETK